MKMTLKQLCEKIRLDSETTETILKLDEKYDHTALAPLWEKLYSSDTWEEGIQQLQEHLGEDPNGFKILTCLLYCAIHTWQIYCQKGISEQIFVETMGFVPRFILWQQKVSGQTALARRMSSSDASDKPQ